MKNIQIILQNFTRMLALYLILCRGMFLDLILLEYFT